MSEINFVNSINKNENKNINTRLKISITIFAITILAISIISFFKTQELKKITSQIKPINPILKTQNQIKSINPAPKTQNQNPQENSQSTTNTEKDLKDQKIELKKQHEAINLLTKTPRAQTTALLSIYNLIDKNFSINSIFIDEKNFTLSAQTSDEKQVNQITKKIAKIKNIKNTKIAGIEKNNSILTFTINGQYS